jgi:hypothetical protein
MVIDAFILRTVMYCRRNQGALFWDHLFRLVNHRPTKQLLQFVGITKYARDSY